MGGVVPTRARQPVLVATTTAALSWRAGRYCGLRRPKERARSEGEGVSARRPRHRVKGGQSAPVKKKGFDRLTRLRSRPRPPLAPSTTRRSPQAAASGQGRFKHWDTRAARVWYMRRARRCEGGRGAGGGDAKRSDRRRAIEGGPPDVEQRPARMKGSVGQPSPSATHREYGLTRWGRQQSLEEVGSGAGEKGAAKVEGRRYCG